MASLAQRCRGSLSSSQCPPYYPSEQLSSSTAAAPPMPGPVHIEDDVSVPNLNHSASLNLLVDPPSKSISSSHPPLLTMCVDDISWLLHHPSSSFSPVRPCNTANASNTKTHWSAEELHRIMGCHRFRNYKHLLQMSRDGEWIDGGEFPLSLCSFATIPKSHHGGALNRTKYRYLDVAHMDIDFGDCISVGGFCYALILVDRATRYNWTFSLKDLSSVHIILALCLFRASAGSLACCFYSDCDLKLFGSNVSEYLIDGSSRVVSEPAKLSLIHI